MIVDQEQDFHDSYKGRTAEKLCIPIVSLAFIDACINEGKLVNYQDYVLSGKPVADSFAKGKIVGKSLRFEYCSCIYEPQLFLALVVRLFVDFSGCKTL